MLSKVRDIIQADGLSALASRSIAYAYRQGVRPFIPRREPVRYAGIPICHDVKWGDRIVPKLWVPVFARNEPNYEVTLVEGTDAVFEAKFMLPWSFSEENIVGDVTGSPSSAVLSARVAIGIGA